MGRSTRPAVLVPARLWRGLEDRHALRGLDLRNFFPKVQAHSAARCPHSSAPLPLRPCPTTACGAARRRRGSERRRVRRGGATQRSRATPTPAPSPPLLATSLVLGLTRTTARGSALKDHPKVKLKFGFSEWRLNALLLSSEENDCVRTKAIDFYYKNSSSEVCFFTR